MRSRSSLAGVTDVHTTPSARPGENAATSPAALPVGEADASAGEAPRSPPARRRPRSAGTPGSMRRCDRRAAGGGSGHRPACRACARRAPAASGRAPRGRCRAPDDWPWPRCGRRHGRGAGAPRPAAAPWRPRRRSATARSPRAWCRTPPGSTRHRRRAAPGRRPSRCPRCVAGGDAGDGPAVAEDHGAAGGKAIEAGRQPRRGAALCGVGEVGADARQWSQVRRAGLNRQLEHEVADQRPRRAHEHEARQPGRLDGHFDAGPDRDRALADDGAEIVGPDRVPGVDADLHRASESPARGRARAASRPRRARSRRAPGRRTHR